MVSVLSGYGHDWPQMNIFIKSKWHTCNSIFITKHLLTPYAMLVSKLTCIFYETRIVCYLKECVLVLLDPLLSLVKGVTGVMGVKGVVRLTRGRYPPSDLDCMRRQDSENIAHC